MGKITVLENLTLDGVMQAPGRPDEDERDGFAHGGWAMPFNDAVKGQMMGKGMAARGALLFGRRTYMDFYSVWPNRTDNPFTTVLNNTRKYVTSTTLRDPLPWENSTLLAGDVAGEIRRLRDSTDDNLLVMGSGVLVQSLLQNDLVDAMQLLVHPITLGSGRKLFDGTAPAFNFELTESVTTTKGVIISTYQRMRR